MAYSTLKNAIAALIDSNGNGDITGPILQSVLNDQIVDDLGALQFRGVATPSTNPGAPDGEVFYLAATSGTYANFSGAILQNELAIITWNGSVWSKLKLVDFSTIAASSFAVIDALNSTSTTDALSANQGRILSNGQSSLTNYIGNVQQNLTLKFLDYIPWNKANTNNGPVLLDATGKVPAQYINNTSLIYKGTWDASSGSAPSANPGDGEFWVITVAGSTTLGGFSAWSIGDWAIYDDQTGWDRIPAVNTQIYNGLDQTNPGYALDARQGKVINDHLGQIDSAINGLTLQADQTEDDINDLQTTVNNNKQEVDDLKSTVAGKMTEVIRIKGTFGGSATNQIIDSRLKNVPAGPGGDSMFYIDLIIDDVHYDMNGLSTLNPVDGIITLAHSFSNVQYKLTLWPLY